MLLIKVGRFEQADLEREGRLVPRQAALALERFDQRGFLATDIGARTPAQMNARGAFGELGDLAGQNLAGNRVLVAQVDVDVRSLDHMGADQHALEEAVRIGVEVELILEGTRFALVAVDRHQPRARLAAHGAPLAPRREAGAAEAAQAAVVEHLQHVVDGQVAAAQPLQHGVATASPVGVVIDVFRDVGVGVLGLDRGADGGEIRLVQEVVADLDGGRVVAQADAGGAHDAHRVGGEFALERLDQFVGAEHRAGDAVADPDGEARDVGFPFLHHVEMRVEGRGLEHLGESEAHLVGERGQMVGADLAVGILHQMQVLDQQVALARAAAEQALDLDLGLRIDLTALRHRAGDVAATARMRKAPDSPRILTHGATCFQPDGAKKRDATGDGAYCPPKARRGCPASERCRVVTAAEAASNEAIRGPTTASRSVSNASSAAFNRSIRSASVAAPVSSRAARRASRTRATNSSVSGGLVSAA